jgi:hypothetical protein
VATAGAGPAGLAPGGERGVASSVPELPAVRPLFRALAEAFVPAAARLDEPGWADLEALVEQALAARPEALRRQLLLFIRALDGLAVLRHGRRLPALDPARRTRLLAAVGRSPVLALRHGVWGLRTLVMMGYYARPAGQAEVGYRASPRGWAARR